MIVNVNMSREVYEYFEGIGDFGQLADALIDSFDMSNLPQTSGERFKEVKMNVSNPMYIELYNRLGARSKQISLGRLFEFAYNMDILNTPTFQMFKSERHDPVPAMLDKIYKLLLEAQKHTKDADNATFLRGITNLLYQYKEEVYG